MGKILVCCIIGLACFAGTGLAKTQKKNYFYGFFFRSEIQEEYKELFENNTIVFFGSEKCAACATQKTILKTLEKNYRVRYFNTYDDVDLYNYMRGKSKMVPMTIIFVDGKIKKRYVGIHSAARIRDKECKINVALW